MKILSSTIKMESTTNYNYVRKNGGSDFLSFLSTSYQNQKANNTDKTNHQIKDARTVTKLPVARLIKINKREEVDTADKLTLIDLSGNELSDQKMIMLQKLIEALTGKKVKLVSTEKNKKQDLNNNLVFIGRVNNQADPTGHRISIVTTANKDNSKDTEFASNGIINTADGRKIDFSISLNLSKESAAKSEPIIDTGKTMIDPLVINFDTNSATLTDTKYSFDIDADGKQDLISFLSQGSGLLAVDLNSDGKINNGLELFGTTTGDGFIELAAKDADNNLWIDENDPIFEKLKIWTKDQTGKDNLLSLKASGIGAIYLNNVDTSHKLTDLKGTIQGELTKTGIFLKENGAVGTIQNVQYLV